MKECERIETPNGEFNLPEAIIQHIQSFLKGRKAAQTSVLSRSWYAAWSTRPKLDFDEAHFSPQDLDKFWDMTRKTMQRYEELKVNIESFRLSITGGYAGDLCEEDMTTMIEEVIVKAIDMGTLDFEFDLHAYDYEFVLPREVFASKTLIRLSVSGCEIDLGKERKVCCSGLKSLELPHDIGNDVLGDILSSCPSIENLILRQAYMVVDYSPVNLHQLHKLKSLWLEGFIPYSLLWRHTTF